MTIIDAFGCGCPFPQFIAIFFFFFLLSLVPGIIQAQYTSAQETLTELDNVSKAYFQIQYLLLSVTDPNKF